MTRLATVFVDKRFTKLFDKRTKSAFLGLRIKMDLPAIGFEQTDIFILSISNVRFHHGCVIDHLICRFIWKQLC